MARGLGEKDKKDDSTETSFQTEPLSPLKPPGGRQGTPIRLSGSAQAAPVPAATPGSPASRGRAETSPLTRHGQECR